MDIAVMNFATNTVTKYVNCPDEWGAEQIESYLYDTLGLHVADTCYIEGSVPFFKKEYAEPEHKMYAAWKRLKDKHPEAILLARCGSFYEAYHEDADIIADILRINVTHGSATMTDADGNPARSAAFPYRSLDVYLPKLIRSGCRVAICDNLEEK